MAHVIADRPAMRSVWIALGLFVTLWWTSIGFTVLYNRHGDDAPAQRLLFLAGSVPAGVAAIAIAPASTADAAALALSLAVIRLVLTAGYVAGGPQRGSPSSSPPCSSRGCAPSCRRTRSSGCSPRGRSCARRSRRGAGSATSTRRPPGASAAGTPARATDGYATRAPIRPRSCRTSASWIAFVAAPLRRLSDTIHRSSAWSWPGSRRMRPTNTSSLPSASIAIG
jgi:hypothetical protein